MDWCVRGWRWPFSRRCIRPYLHDPALKVAQLQQPALTRTVALMRGPQALAPLIEECFFSVTVRIALGQVFYQYVHRQMVDVLQRVRGEHPQ